MSEINTGGPAFPVPEENYISNGTYSNPGMDLRDWFAGQVLSGLVARGSYSGHDADIAAKFSYKYADAMIAAREGRP